MFLVDKLIILLVFTICILQSASISPNTCSSGLCDVQFDRLSLSSDLKIYGSEQSLEQSLSLISAGMRKKNLFVVEVDVYKIGIYTNELLDKSLGLKETANLDAKLVDSISVNGIPSLGIVLDFVRSVQANKVVDAIVDALSSKVKDDAYELELKRFSGALLDAIGISGAQMGTQIIFYFFGSEGMSMWFNPDGKGGNEVKLGLFTDSLLKSRLIDLYVGPKAISPIVNKIILDRYKK
eukprot:gene13957-18720_t